MGLPSQQRPPQGDSRHPRWQGRGLGRAADCGASFLGPSPLSAVSGKKAYAACEFVLIARGYEDKHHHRPRHGVTETRPWLVLCG